MVDPSFGVDHRNPVEGIAAVVAGILQTVAVAEQIVVVERVRQTAAVVAVGSHRVAAVGVDLEAGSVGLEGSC